MVILTREVYKRIKSMNRQEMEDYLSNLEVDSYNKGVSSISQVVADSIDRGLRSTPGIGPKRYEEIAKNIIKEFHRPGREYEIDK